MKHTFTYLRICFFITLFSLSSTNIFAQTAQLADAAVVSNLKATVQKNSLVLSWNATEAETSNYSEVQASEDGKTFSTIGLVMGADPKQANSYTFKQDITKLKPGQSFYRVLSVDTNNIAYTSSVVNLTK